jgi:hypothetical protein
VWPRTIVLARRLAIGVALLVGLSLPVTTPAGAAAALPFAFFIENGLDFEPFVDPNGMTGFFSAQRNVLAIVDGRKTSAVLGTATILAWSRTVPDPFFASLGPVAALGILHFPEPFNVEVHLGLFQDSSGASRTTVAAYRIIGGAFVADPTVRGTWRTLNATDVGGDPADLLVSGEWVTGAPTALATGAIRLEPYPPTVPFPGDPAPTTTHCLNALCTKRLGSFYGHTLLGGEDRMARSYGISSPTVPGGVTAHLTVVEAGESDHIVVACSGFVLGSGSLQGPCTLSGTGDSAGLVTGWAHYTPAGLSTDLNVTPYLVLP